MKVFFARESNNIEEEVKCYSPVGVAHVQCQNCWVSLNLHALGFVEGLFLIWSIQEMKHHPSSTTSVCKSHHNWWIR